MRPLLRLAHDRPWVVAAGLVVLHGVVGVLAFDPGPHVGGDNTAYLALARSLLDHGRYLELWNPARPPHTQYPPGFPVILAVAWTLGIRSWMGMKLMMLGFSAAAVGLSYLWMRTRTTATTAAGLGLILAVAPGVAAENQWILSDVPFWAVTMGALLALERGRTGWGIVLAFCALALRTAGLPLLVAIVVWLGLRRRWRPALTTAAVLIAVAVLWTLRAPAVENPYVSQFWLQDPYVPELGRVGAAGLLERLVGNAEQYGLRILMRTLVGAAGLLAAVGGVVLAGSAAAGFVARLAGRVEGPDNGASTADRTTGAARAAREARATRPARVGALRIGPVEIFAVLYAGMLLLWPEPWASDRFLFPLLPVLLVYAASGVSALPWPAARGRVRVGAAALILGFALPPSFMLWSMAAECRAAVRESGLFACLAPEQRAFLELAEWSRGRLPDDAVVISRKPRQWYWFSGYPGEVYPFTLDHEKLLERAARLGARYVVLDELGGTAEVYLLPAVTELQRRFCLIRGRQQPTGKGATLLGVLPDSWDPPLMEIERDATGPIRFPPCPPGLVSASAASTEPSARLPGSGGGADG
ncbi:MAG: ArnT family glycosyltransferase [Candidatus Longimicrobiales bacterium M2_2A_002]